MDNLIKRIPFFILGIIVILSLVFRDNMSVLIVSIMCGLIGISIMSTVYTGKVKKGKEVDRTKFLLLTLVIASAVFAGVYFGGNQLLGL
jgi:hypothetical protein